MAHPVSLLNAALITAWSADAELNQLIGANAIFESPGRGLEPPYVVVTRHDVRGRNTDASPGWDHRLRVTIWAGDPNTKEALAIAERLVSVAANLTLSGPQLWLTHVEHVSTQSGIEPRSGRGRAVVDWRFLTEPQA